MHNGQSGSLLAVIDGNTNRKINDIEIGAGPADLAGLEINPFTHNVYFGRTNYTSSSIFIVDGMTGNVTKMNDIHNATGLLAVDPFVNVQVYMGSSDSINAFYVLNGRDGSVTSILPIPKPDGRVMKMIIDAGTNRFFVLEDETCKGSGMCFPIGKLYVISGSTNSPPMQSDDIRAPSDMVVDFKNGRIYIAQHSGSVSILDATTLDLINSTKPIRNELSGYEVTVAVNPNSDTLYVADALSNSVMVFDGAGNNIVVPEFSMSGMSVIATIITSVTLLLSKYRAIRSNLSTEGA